MTKWPIVSQASDMTPSNHITPWDQEQDRTTGMLYGTEEDSLKIIKRNFVAALDSTRNIFFTLQCIVCLLDSVKSLLL